MLKRATLTLACLALVASFSGIARADAISFSFLFGGTAIVQNNASGLSAGPGVVLVVSDDDTATYIAVNGAAIVSTGGSTSWGVSSGIFNASFGPGGSVSVTAPTGVCPPDCGPTLVSGTMEDGSLYSAALGGGNGSFHGLFSVTYVSPKILALFGLGPSFLPDGAVSLNSSSNNMVTATKDSATLAGGTVTINTPTPEPGTLALCGTGIIGLASVLRRKIS